MPDVCRFPVVTLVVAKFVVAFCCCSFVCLFVSVCVFFIEAMDDQTSKGETTTGQLSIINTIATIVINK